jgi:hypothetical protein
VYPAAKMRDCTPAEGVVEIHRRGGQPLAICTAADRLNRSISEKVYHEAKKGTWFCLLVAVISILIGLLLGRTALAQRSMAFSWSPGQNPGWTACLFGPHCLTGYTFYETTSGTPFTIATITQDKTSYTMMPIPSVGTHIYSVVQNGTDGNSKPTQSTTNPGIVINCWRVGLWRTCKPGKSW